MNEELREKVIRGLECCILHDPDDKPRCEICPYDGACLNRLKHDVLQLLKEQEPRVLTLEEVIQHYSLPLVFPDDFCMQEDYYEDIQPLYFEFPHDNEDPWIVHWRGHAQVGQYLDEWGNTYNMEWRCWTAKPTDEQKKAVKWDE